MASRPATTRAASVSQDQNQHHNQNHVRTRSQLALPEFNIEYDRSPLKNAREALRRAKARYGEPSGEATGGKLNGEVDADVGIDGKMKEVMARAKTGSSSNPFRRNAAEKESKERKVTVSEEVRSERAQASVDSEEGSSTTPRQPLNPFDFSVETDDEHPRYPKRGRSASFDEGVPSPPTGSEAKAEASNTTNVLTTAPTQSNLLEINLGGDAHLDSTTIPSSSDSTPTTGGESNPKRVKLGSQKTLDGFFARPSSSQSKGLPTKILQSTSGPIRGSAKASSGSCLEEVSSTPQKGTLSVGSEAVLYAKTPTIKELRAIPSLDLRTMTPSPRKRTLQIGLGTPGPMTGAKARAVSAGAALTYRRSEALAEDADDSDESKEENKRATSEPRDEVATSEQQSLKAAPRTPRAPRRSPPLIEGEPQIRMMDVDVDRIPTKSTEAVSTREDIPRSMSQSIPSSSKSASVELAQKTDLLDSQPEDDASRLKPQTPLHKILPSRPLPSRHPPSAKGCSSRIFGTSPLTPLSVLGPPSGDSDDYQEEERKVREENKRVAGLEAAKLAMQEEGEPEPDLAEELPQTMGPLFAQSPSKPTASPAINRKSSTKGKQKGKRLSSTSRIVAGAVGVKKRKSLVPSASSTPRMRLTRASVLRQKAIQSQMRTPKDKVRRSSILPSKNTATGPKKDEAETKEKEVKEVKKGNSGQQGSEISGEKKKAEPGPQRVPRKTFVLTVPSSLSPRKATSISSSANSSVTLKSAPLQSSPSKSFTFSLYPPSLNDTAATEQAQRALNKLSSALDKLAMPPPSKPSSSVSGNGAELKRPASEQPERTRPASSLGFTRETSVPATGTARGEGGRPRAASRAGSVEPAKRFLPPPPPAFGSSLAKEKGKAKGSAIASRTAPVTFGVNAGNSRGSSQVRPPSSFRFGLGAGGVFGRPIPRIRASKKTSLETVQGSPVKGGDQGFKEDDEDEIMPVDGTGGPGDSGAEADASASSSNTNADTSISSMESGDVPTGTAATISANGKELKRISKLNASRRASMAFSTLARSLGTSPDPFSPDEVNLGIGNTEERTPTGSATDNGKGPGSATSAIAASRPVRAAALRSFGFGAPGLSRTQSETAVSNNGRVSSLTPSLASESDGEGPGRSTTKKSGGSMGRTKMPGSLDVLNKCTIFVDVRTDEGEDAGALFVDMLRGLGAKVLTRVGQTCTHIVYKNGLSSTVTRYRLLDEPRPKVVGIGWVVECAEKRVQVDESRFQVDLENANVAGTLKRRRSFLPKQIISTNAPGPMDAFLSGSTSGSDTATATNPVPKACADPESTSEDGDTSQERVLSGSSLSSNIHPLERARRRSIMIPR